MSPQAQARRSSQSAISEATPLLLAEPIPIDESLVSADLDGFCTASTDHGKHADVPLPMKQILLLCFARIIDPVAYFSIFPFINQMIEETGGIKKTDVGFYSGLIESCFSLTQMCFMLAWGRASDRIGRKPVLIFSLCGCAIATAIFGLSTSIPQMIIFRCCGGLFAGTIVTLRVMFSENSTPKTQARAFSLFAFSGNVGLFVGPLIGGSLSNPAKQIPFIFGNIKFFKDFPYALPTFITGSIGLVAALTSGLFVKETLKKKAKDDSATANPPMSLWQLIKAPGVFYALVLNSYVGVLAFAYTAVIPVFWYTPVESGGFGFTPAQISLFISTAGVSQAVWLLLCFPPLQKRYTTRGVLKACFVAWPIFFCFSPLCNYFLRRGWTTAFWIVAPTATVLGSGVSMAFIGIQLALNDASPAPETLGTLNGLALSLSSGIRAFSPAAFTSLFAVGVRTQLLNGYLVWLVLVAIALMGTMLIRWYPEPKDVDE